MSDLAELIIEFRRGVSEDTARAAVTAQDATVRRRMRSDHSDQVLLLIRLAADRLKVVHAALDGHADVTRTEVNAGGFHAT